MIRDNVDVAAAGTPKAERAFLFDKGLDRGALEGGERSRNFFDRDLQAHGTNGIKFLFRRGEPPNEVVIAFILSAKYRKEI